MNKQEFEKILKNTMQIKAKPARDSLERALSKLEIDTVTESEDVRYNRQTATPSYIINNKIADFISVWKSRRIVLVPSLILLLFIGTFSLSGSTLTHDKSILKLAQQDGSIEEADIVDDYSDLVTLTSFDDQTIDELGTTQDEF
jgi:hypothetical protein